MSLTVSQIDAAISALMTLRSSEAKVRIISMPIPADSNVVKYSAFNFQKRRPFLALSRPTPSSPYSFSTPVTGSTIDDDNLHDEDGNPIIDLEAFAWFDDLETLGEAIKQALNLPNYLPTPTPSIDSDRGRTVDLCSSDDCCKQGDPVDSFLSNLGNQLRDLFAGRR
jgi:hypothetical protein